MEKNLNQKSTWKTAKGLGGNFEYNPKTNEVRMKDSKKIVKNLLYSPENSIIKEYRGDLEDYLSEYNVVDVEIKLNKKKPKETTKEFLVPIEEVEELISEAIETGGYLSVHINGDPKDNRVSNLKYVPFDEWKYYSKGVSMIDLKTGELLEEYPNIMNVAEAFDEDPEEIYNFISKGGKEDE